MNGRLRLVVTFRDFFVLATCYAQPSGRVRPAVVIHINEVLVV
jgi:hypothetical protein